jgi:serine/threonine protein kinase
VFDRYELRRVLGRGGMGAVFLAHDPQLDRLVALKLPGFAGADRDTLRERFLREARAAAGLRHPNLCPVFDVGRVGDLPFLTMAYIEGTPLADLLRAGRLPPVAVAARWVRAIALAVDEAHRHGIVHRDLKPSNVIIDRRDEPIVTDFGLAYRPAPSGDARLTRSGAVVGTPAYMPPEQAGAGGPVGPAGDVYSLGVVLFETLTGRLPFQATTLGELLAQVARDLPPPPSRFRPGLPPGLDRVCLKALAKRPADRYARMTEFAAALAPFAGGTGTESASTSSPASVSPPPAVGVGFPQPAAPTAPRPDPERRSLSAAESRRLAPLLDRARALSRAAAPAQDARAADFGTVAYEEHLRQARRRRARRRLVLALAAVAAVVLGLVLYSAYGPGQSRRAGTDARNPLVTRDNYLRIKPDMTAWEVSDLLGPGAIAGEDGLIVDAAGGFKKWSRGGGRYNEQTGTVPNHDGRPSRQVKQEVVWRSGDKVIRVIFLNDRVTDKGEEGLIGE